MSNYNPKYDQDIDNSLRDRAKFERNIWLQLRKLKVRFSKKKAS